MNFCKRGSADSDEKVLDCEGDAHGRADKLNFCTRGGADSGENVLDFDGDAQERAYK
ncbi:MAG TPA: hypothetical protein V6C81_20600 [Planktothrix sp.]